MKSEQNSESKISKAFNTVLTVIPVVLMTVLIYVTVCIMQGKPVMFAGKCVLRVITGSMQPTFYVGDCIIMEQVSPEVLQVGDIIVYTSEAEDISGMLVVHRISECLPDGTFTTWGDANPVPDSLPVKSSQIWGRYVKKSHFFKWLTSFADFQKVILLAVMITTTVMAFYEVRTIAQLEQKIHEESAEERHERLMREAIEKEKQRLAQEHYQPEQEGGEQD